MLEKIIENRNKILTALAILLLLSIGLWSFFNSNSLIQKQNEANQPLPDNAPLSNLPENKTGIPQNTDDVNLDQPNIRISDQLQSTIKISKIDNAEELILNNQPEYTDLNSNLDTNIIIIPNSQATANSIDDEANSTLKSTILPDLGDFEDKNLSFLIRDENGNLFSLGYGIELFKSFKVNNRQFYVAIKTDLTSGSYVYAGYDLAKLVLLNTNLTDGILASVSINRNLIYYKVAKNQNPSEDSFDNFAEFHIDVFNLGEQDLTKRIDFEEIITKPQKIIDF